MSQPNDKAMCVLHDIINRAKNGNVDDISYLYQHFSSIVFGYIYNRTRDYHTAEDLTSVVFFKMVENIQKVRANNEVSFRAWLFKVAHTTIAQHYLDRKRIECISLEATLEIPCVTEKQSTVTEAFDKLTEEQRQVLDNTVILGYSAEEVGRMLGKKACAVRSLQFRGLSTMKRILVAALLIVLVLLGVTIKLIYNANPGNVLYPIKSLGKHVLPSRQEKKPTIQPMPTSTKVPQDAHSILPSMPSPTSTATSTPISSKVIVQPTSTATPIPATPTMESAQLPCVARMCLLP